MSEPVEKHIDYRKLGGAWNLTAKVREDGSIASASDNIIMIAQLLLIRDTMREVADGITAVRHFVHALGGDKLRLLVREAHRREARNVRRRRAAAKRVKERTR